MGFETIELSKYSTNSKINANIGHLSCWYTNATSLNNKFDELISEVDRKKTQIIMICETWWTDASVTNIEGYNLFKKDRELKRGGGVCMYVDNSVKSYDISNIVLKNENIEQIWCSIEIGDESILCGCFYRTGDSDVSYCKELVNSIKIAKGLLTSKKYTGLLIGGDFNFPIKIN